MVQDILDMKYALHVFFLFTTVYMLLRVSIDINLEKKSFQLALNSNHLCNSKTKVINFNKYHVLLDVTQFKVV